VERELVEQEDLIMKITLQLWLKTT